MFEIDVATPANTNIRNQGKYQELKEQLVQKWKVIGWLGPVTLKLEEWLQQISGTTAL